MTSPKIRLGKWGEDTAARFLKDKGYLILETNYRCRWGEIDIVAVDEGQIVFVEVRTRKGNAFGTPEESITHAKRRRMVVTAQTYLRERGQEGLDWRVDLVAIRLGSRQRLESVEHIRYAIEG